MPDRDELTAQFQKTAAQGYWLGLVSGLVLGIIIGAGAMYYYKDDTTVFILPNENQIDT